MNNPEHKNKQSVDILQNINLNLRAGDRLGIIGPNGAGKSSLLRIMAGIYKPTKGTIKIEGKISTFLDLLLGLDPEASGIEYIKIRGLLNGLSLKEIKLIEEEVIDFTGMRKIIDHPIRTYSSGMSLRLGFALSTSIPADILIMDEWLSVGDSSFIQKAELRLLNFIDKTSIVILASHSEDLINKIATKKLILERHGW